MSLAENVPNPCQKYPVSVATRGRKLNRGLLRRYPVVSHTHKSLKSVSKCGHWLGSMYWLQLHHLPLTLSNRKVEWWMRSDKVCRNVNMVRDQWRVQMWTRIMWMWSEDFFSTLQLQRQISSIPVLHRVYSCMKSSVLQLVNITEQAVKQTEPVCQDVVRLRHDIMHRIKKKKHPRLSGWGVIRRRLCNLIPV